MPGRIELSEPVGTTAELVVTSGAGVAAMELLVECATGAAIFSAGKTFGRREFTGDEFFSDFASSEFEAAPPGVAPCFGAAVEFWVDVGFVAGCEFDPVGTIPG